MEYIITFTDPYALDGALRYKVTSTRKAFAIQAAQGMIGMSLSNHGNFAVEKQKRKPKNNSKNNLTSNQPQETIQSAVEEPPNDADNSIQSS